MAFITAQEVIDVYAEFDIELSIGKADQIAQELNEIAETDEPLANACLYGWAEDEAAYIRAEGAEAAEYEDAAYGPRDEE